MTDPYILQAREIFAAECEKNGHSESAECYRDGIWDQCRDVTVLARVLREQPPQPTFEQRVEAVARAREMCGYAFTSEDLLRVYEREIAEIMAPKVDPLVEALCEMDPDNMPNEADAENLRKALAARGLEIREITK